jgi:putative transposase
MRQEGLRSQIGYRRRPGRYVGKPPVASPTSDLAIDALLMAVWRRKPKQEVMIHSDQGSQFSSGDWQGFLKAKNLLGSMSRRGNRQDNAR